MHERQLVIRLRSSASAVLLMAGLAGILYALSTGAGDALRERADSAARTVSAAPSIASFTVTPPVIGPGAGATLSWVVANATKVVIDPGFGEVAAAGSMLVYPAASTYYTLIATNASGTSTASVFVKVEASYPGPGNPPAIEFFGASPPSVGPGAGSTLSWVTSGASSVWLEPGLGPRPSTGTLLVYPSRTTTYTLNAANSHGTVSRSVIVNVEASYPGPGSPPEIVSFTATPQTIAPGGAATLTWSTRGASEVVIDNGVGARPVSGSTVVSPTTTTHYTLRATNSSGSTSASIQVRVENSSSDKPLIQSFTVTPSTIEPGGSAVLAWTTSNADLVSIDPGVGSVATTGSHIVAPLVTTSYRLTAFRGSESVSAVVTVSVADGACRPSDDTLCLNHARFRINVNWKDFQGLEGIGHGDTLTRDTGQFWFFNPENVELVIKVLDGRPINGRFWVFYGALSNVEYTITVTDTETGKVRTYFNPSGQFASVGDTEAF